MEFKLRILVGNGGPGGAVESDLVTVGEQEWW